MKGLSELKNSLKDSPLIKNRFVEKYRIILVPIIAMVLAALIIILITIPQFLKLFETFKTIDELNQKKAFYQQKKKELQAINQENFRKDLDTALIALPIEKDIPGVMGELLVALGGSGMNLNGITFSSSPVESEKTQEYTIAIDVVGEESSLRNFLERVTLSPRLIKLNSIEISKSSGQAINASVTFVTFYQLLPKTIGSVDDNLPKIAPADTQTLADIADKIRSFPKVNDQNSKPAIGKLDPFRP